MMWSRITRIARVQRAYGFAIWACLATAFLARAPAAWAAEQEIKFHDQSLWVDGLSGMVWVGDESAADSELILIFSNTTATASSSASSTASFRCEYPFEAQMLLVGGGGAGGYGNTGTTYPGGGGGGGEV